MSDKQQSGHDLLEEAVHAFQRMSVPERPLDAEVLAQCGLRPGDSPGPSCIPIPLNRRFSMHVLLSATVAAVLLIGGLALFLGNSSSPESVAVKKTASTSETGDDAVQPSPKTEKFESAAVQSLKDRVAESQVIVVATALDSAPAPPPTIPGDQQEVLLRWKVKRILKGQLTEKVITTRSSFAADLFIGKDWIVWLRRDYKLEEHQSAACTAVEVEPFVKSLLLEDKK